MENKDLEVKGMGYLAAGSFGEDRGIREELWGLNGGFEKVRIPGTGLVFEVMGERGRPELVKEIEGVILYHHPVNSFYKDEYTGGNNPPDCGSLDGEFGFGIPGGSCSECIYNKFGSRSEGRGKACKNKRRIFILREGEVLPVLLTLPTGSLREFSNYIKRLLTKGKRSVSVVTRIGLKRAVSTGGVQYVQADFSFVRDLTFDENEALYEIAEYVKGKVLEVSPWEEYGDIEEQ